MTDAPKKRQYRKSGNKKLSAFLVKLRQMLEDPSMGHLLHWNSEEDGFVVSNVAGLAAELPRFGFHTVSFHAFNRQLQLYQFDRNTLDKAEKVYLYKQKDRLFVRSDPSLGMHICRMEKLPSSSDKSSSSAPATAHVVSAFQVNSEASVSERVRMLEAAMSDYTREIYDVRVECAQLAKRIRLLEDALPPPPTVPIIGFDPCEGASEEDEMNVPPPVPVRRATSFEAFLTERETM